MREGKRGAKEADVTQTTASYSDAQGMNGKAAMQLHMAALFLVGTLARLID